MGVGNGWEVVFSSVFGWEVVGSDVKWWVVMGSCE